MTGINAMKCRIPDWNEISTLASEVAEKVKQQKFTPTVLVAISRGGLVPARLLSDLLGIKTIYTLKVDHWGVTATPDGTAQLSQKLPHSLDEQNVLLADDVTDTGQSMELAKKHLLECNAGTVKTATLYNLTGSKHTPDFSGTTMDWQWIVFPWNYWEDMASLVGRAEAEGMNNTSVDLLNKLKNNFGIELSSEQLQKIQEHKKYLAGKTV